MYALLFLASLPNPLRCRGCVPVWLVPVGRRHPAPLTGSALLVGVGGSGKQSLARLAAFISGLEVTQIQLKKGYGVADLKNELSGLYLKAGLKNVGIMFLMTDAQIPNEQFLVLINDMLASGEIPDLFPDDEVENIIAGVRNEVKGKFVPRRVFAVCLPSSARPATPSFCIIC